MINENDMELIKNFIMFYKKFNGYNNYNNLKESELDLIHLFLGEKYEE